MLRFVLLLMAVGAFAAPPLAAQPVCDAGDLPPNGSSAGSLDGANNSDFWCVTIPADGALPLTVVNDPTLTLDLYLYDADFRNLAVDNSRDGEQTVFRPDLAAGTYIVYIARVAGSGGYRISSNFTAQPLGNDPEPNDSQDQAATLGPGSMATGHLGFLAAGRFDNADWYKVTIPADGALQLMVVNDATLTLDLYLYDAAFRTLAADNSRDGEQTVFRPDLAPGTYFVYIVRVAGFGGYRINSNFTAQPLGDDPEPNDSPDQAATLGLGSMATGHLGFLAAGAFDNVDWYQVTVPADGALQVMVVNDTTLSLDLYLYDAAFRNLAADNSRDGEQMVFRPDLAPGTYFVYIARVAGFGGYRISSNFTAQPLGNDPEPNNSPDQAATLGLGSMATGHLGFLAAGAFDNVDWYQVTIPADGALQVMVVNDPTLTLDLYLYDAAFRNLAADNSRDGEQTVFRPDLAAGTYFAYIVRVAGFGGYQIAASSSGSNAFPFPSAADFGSIPVGDVSAPKVFTLRNAGVADLVVGVLQVSGPGASAFAIQEDLASSEVIPPLASRTFKVVFAPPAAGEWHAVVEIPSNDPDTPVTAVPLKGVAVPGQDSTAPTTTASAAPGPNAHGWNNTNVTVTLNATDDPGGSGVREIVFSLAGAQGGAGVASGDTALVQISAEGVTTLTFFARDNAGNEEPAETLTIRIDKTSPMATCNSSPGPNLNGWNNSDVLVTFGADDDMSGVETTPAPVHVTTEAADQAVTGTATDKAGNSASATCRVSIDKTPPSVSARVSPPPNANGWNNTSVTVSFDATDALSGLSSVTDPLTVAGEGAGQIVTGTATDRAGNSAGTSVTVNLDRTPPVITGLPASDCTLWSPDHSLVSVADVTATDPLSGLAAGSLVVTGTSNEPENGLGDGDTAPDIVITGGVVYVRAERSGIGTGRLYTLTAAAGDLAGNRATAVGTCAVPHDQR